MPAIRYDALAAEVGADPLHLGYAGKGDVAVAALLNGQQAGYSVALPQVPLNSLLKWAASGPIQKIQDYAANAANNAALRALCLATQQVLGGAAPYFDLSDPALNNDGTPPGMLQQLVAGGVLSAADKTALQALGTRSPASRAEVLFGAGVTVAARDVAVAMGRAS